MTLCQARGADCVRVTRFMRPNVREAIYDNEAIAETSLYQELQKGAIEGLVPGSTLIMNFGLNDWFPTALYGTMIQALQDVRAAAAFWSVACQKTFGRALK